MKRAITAVIAVVSLWAPDAVAKGIEGTYEINRTKVDGGKPYTGTVTITRRGKIFAMAWKTSKGNYTGIAIQAGKTLWASGGKGDCGLFLYQMRGKSKAVGRWTRQSSRGKFGTETITDGVSIKGRNPRRKRYKGYLDISVVGTIEKLDKATALVDHVMGKRKASGVITRRGKTVAMATSCALLAYRIRGTELHGTIPNPGMSQPGGDEAFDGTENLRRAGSGKLGGRLVYRDRGVSVTIPAGWKAGDGKGKFEAPTVIGGYQDNMSITITAPFQLNRKSARMLQKVLVQQFQKIFPDYRVKSMKVLRFGKFRALHLVGRVTVQGHHLLISQAVISTPRAGVMVGCNYAVKRNGTTGKLCRASFKSVR